MKLIDILLAADFKWPEGAAVAVQDGRGEIWWTSGDDIQERRSADLADDYATAIITREQYLQAVEAKRGAVDAGPVSADAAPIPYPSLSLYGDRRDVLTKALAFFVKWDQHALEAETMLGNAGSSYQQRITTAQDMLRELGVHHADPL